MAESIVTTIAKKKMVEARAGIAPVSPIVAMAFGNGATDPSHYPHDPDDNTLKNQLLRKNIDGYQKVTDTCYNYICTLTKSELANEFINEIALCDSDGDLVAVKAFSPKGKDDDMEMAFEVEDIF